MSLVEFKAKNGAVLGAWRLEKKLGAGGQGSVWRVRSSAATHQIPRALKLCTASDDQQRMRFEREVALLRSCESQFVPTVHDADTSWEPSEGGTALAWYVADLGVPLPALPNVNRSPLFAIQIFRQACECIAFLHEHSEQVLHRDIKPDNFLWMEEEPSRLVVTDFGIAKSAGQVGVTKMNEAVGTPDWRAPEVRRGSAASPQSEVYGLGWMLLWLLTGRGPEGNRISLAGTAPLSRAAAGALEMVIDRAAAYEPTERFASVRELIATLPPLHIDVAHPNSAPLGATRSGSTTVEKEVLGFEYASSQHLEAFDCFYSMPQSRVEAKTLLPLTKKLGIDDQSTLDALEILDGEGLLKVSTVAGPSRFAFVSRTLYGYEMFLRWRQPDYPKHRDAVAHLLMDDERLDVPKVGEALGISDDIALHILRWYDEMDFVRLSKERGPHKQVVRVHPKLRASIASGEFGPRPAATKVALDRSTPMAIVEWAKQCDEGDWRRLAAAQAPFVSARLEEWRRDVGDAIAVTTASAEVLLSAVSDALDRLSPAAALACVGIERGNLPFRDATPLLDNLITLPMSGTPGSLSISGPWVAAWAVNYLLGAVSLFHGRFDSATELATLIVVDPNPRVDASFTLTNYAELVSLPATLRHWQRSSWDFLCQLPVDRSWLAGIVPPESFESALVAYNLTLAAVELAERVRDRGLDHTIQRQPVVLPLCGYSDHNNLKIGLRLLFRNDDAIERFCAGLKVDPGAFRAAWNAARFGGFTSAAGQQLGLSRFKASTARHLELP